MHVIGQEIPHKDFTAPCLLLIIRYVVTISIKIPTPTPTPTINPTLLQTNEAPQALTYPGPTASPRPLPLFLPSSPSQPPRPTHPLLSHPHLLQTNEAPQALTYPAPTTFPPSPPSLPSFLPIPTAQTHSPPSPPPSPHTSLSTQLLTRHQQTRNPIISADASIDQPSLPLSPASNSHLRSSIALPCSSFPFSFLFCTFSLSVVVVVEKGLGGVVWCGKAM